MTLAVAESVPVAPVPSKEEKATKLKKAATHPPYKTMIREAITALEDIGGSSRQAIFKYIIKTHKIKDDKVSRAHLKLALIRGVANGELKQSKVSEAPGSLKLRVTKETEKNPKSKKPIEKLIVEKAKGQKKDVKSQNAAAKKPQVTKPSTKKATKKTKK